MARFAVLSGAFGAALLCFASMVLACLLVACPIESLSGWILTNLWWDRGMVLLFSAFALLIVLPLAVLARAHIRRPFTAAAAVGFVSSTLATVCAWHAVGERSEWKVFHYAFPYFVAWSMYAYYVIRVWPQTRLTFNPLRWCLGTFVCIFVFSWVSAPRGTVSPVSVDFIEMIKQTAILFLVLFPVWLPALLGTKWPTLSKGIGCLMFVLAAIYPLSVLLMDTSRSDANFWLLSAAAVLVGVAHLTLRSSGLPAAATELQR
jgi:hypothetical protein